LNARSLRFGIRENDHFAICRNAEKYRSSSEGPAPVAPSDISSSPSSLPPSGSLGGSAPGGLGLGGNKGNKRYRSISGKMAAIKSLGDKGLISAEDRGHLKDILLNNDNPALQEALDIYNNTGEFQAVKQLLMNEMTNPSAKRNTNEWLSESLINDIVLDFNTKEEKKSSGIAFGQATSQTTNSSDSYLYHQQPSSSDDSNLTASDVFDALPPTVPVTSSAQYQKQYQQQQQWSNNSSAYTSARPQQAQQQQQTSGIYSSSQVNMPMRDRNRINMIMKQRNAAVSAADAASYPVNSPVNASVQQIPGTSASQQMYINHIRNLQAMGYETSPHMNTAGIMSPGVNPFVMATNGMMSPYGHHQQQAYGMNTYGTSAGGYSAVYDPYHAYQTGNGAHGYGAYNVNAYASGNWGVPSIPKYPGPCSKEEKKEKIARWLKKRENRNWSNKPSYPVRHSIAKNRKRGEDGRFITKAKLAEMEKAELPAGGDSTSLPIGDTTSEFDDCNATVLSEVETVET
jgi:hypothetical protein